MFHFLECFEKRLKKLEDKNFITIDYHTYCEDCKCLISKRSPTHRIIKRCDVEKEEWRCNKGCWFTCDCAEKVVEIYKCERCKLCPIKSKKK